MSLRGDISTLKEFAAALRALPRVVAQKVALAAAPALTEVARATFSAGEDAYGLPWKEGSEGQRVDLQESGALARGVKYTAIGTKIRVVLGVAYAKYQVGRRPIFPRQGSPLPASYVAALTKAANDVIREELKVAS